MFFDQAPATDPSLQQIVAIGTHLSTGYTKKTVAVGSGKSVSNSQPNKKPRVGEQPKISWKPPPKKEFIKQMNSNKPKLNRDLFPSNPEQKFYINQYHIT